MTDQTNTQPLAEGLAEIELLIERGHVAAAQTLAQQLLLQQPNSAAVHAALGDIAGARHLHREAIEWYELSLRLEQRQPVRERLARQQSLLDDERLQSVELPEAAPNRRNLIIIGAAGAAVLVLLCLVLIVGAMRHRQQTESGQPLQTGRPTVRVNQTNPPAGVNEIPRSGEGAGTASPYGVGLGSGATPQSPGTSASGLRVTQSVDAPMADRDVLLTRALSSLTWSNGEALSWRVLALMDPFTGYALISLEVPPAMRTGDLYTPAIDMAWKLAVAAVRADRGVDSLTVRLLTQVENDKGRKVGLVAFRGNTTREAVDYYLKRGLQPDADTIWRHVFATTWWNPSVPAGNAAPAGTGATPEPTASTQGVQTAPTAIPAPAQ